MNQPNGCMGSSASTMCNPCPYDGNCKECNAVAEDYITDKCRLIRFIDKLIPNDFKCNHFSLTFNDDDSASIYISNHTDTDN